MYKFISVILSLVLILSLSACGGEPALQAGGTSGNSGGSAPQAGDANGSSGGLALQTGSTNGNGGEAAEESEISLTGEIGGEITVSSYETLKNKVFLEEAARLFEEKYPGTTVNIEAFSAMPEVKASGDMMIVGNQNNLQSRQDYINMINTALMSGGGADILAMDVLPFHKCAEAGQLENLAAYIQADSEFNKADYCGNILDILEYKSGIWFLPMDYTFNYYAYDSALLTGNMASGFGTDGNFTAEELISLAEPSFDGSAQFFNRPHYTQGPRPDMWSILLAENYTSFVDIENRKANFNDGSFAALLESVKQYSEQGYLLKGQTRQTDTGEMMTKAGERAADKFLFKPQSVINLISLFTRNMGMAMTAMAEGGTMAVGDDDEIAGIAACADGSVPFTYEQAYGINSNSKNKETAWAFIRFLLSEEMQLNTNLSPTALPILNAAREKKMEIMLTSMLEQQGQSLNEAHLESIAKYNETVEKLSSQIDTYIIDDTIVNDMIAVEVQYFFEGTKTAAEAADVLQNKVSLYLNE